jgi:hypothetical protein
VGGDFTDLMNDQGLEEKSLLRDNPQRGGHQSICPDRRGDAKSSSEGGLGGRRRGAHSRGPGTVSGAFA